MEWLANNYKNFGATLEIITDKSQEGSQFVRGFGGIGGTFLLLTFFVYCTMYGCVCGQMLFLLIGEFFVLLGRRNPALQSGFSITTGR